MSAGSHGPRSCMEGSAFSCHVISQGSESKSLPRFCILQVSLQRDEDPASSDMLHRTRARPRRRGSHRCWSHKETSSPWIRPRPA